MANTFLGGADIEQDTLPFADAASGDPIPWRGKYAGRGRTKPGLLQACVMGGHPYYVANHSEAERYSTCSEKCQREFCRLRAQEQGAEVAAANAALTEKRCTKCQRVKPISAYRPHEKDGPPPSVCWECVKEYTRNRNAAKRRERREAQGLPAASAPPVGSRKCPSCKRRRPLSDYRWRIDGKRASQACIHCERAANQAELRCSKCRKTKEPEEFYWKPNGKLRFSHCKACQDEMTQRWLRENREHYNDWQRRNRRAKRLGLSIEQFEALDPALSLVCEGCGAQVSDASGRRLPMDHDHVTELLRGVLCARCNQAIGLLGDDPALLRRLAEYLEQPPRWPGIKVKLSSSGTSKRRAA